MSFYKSITFNDPPVDMDPNAPGTFIRWAFFTEGLFNCLGAFPLIFAPKLILPYITNTPTSSPPQPSPNTSTSTSKNTSSPSIPTPTATPTHATITTDLLRLSGILILTLTPQLFLCLDNTRHSVESRRIVYYTLGAGEFFLLPFFAWTAFRKQSEDGTGIKRSFARMAGLTMAGLLVWRVYVLFWEPQLFGRYRDLSAGRFGGQ